MNDKRTPFPKLSQPALRALHNAGYTCVEDIMNLTDKQLLKLHGMGPGSVKTIRLAINTLPS